MSVSKRTRTRTTTENNVPKNRFLEPVYIKSHVWLQNVLELIHYNVYVNCKSMSIFISLRLLQQLLTMLQI